MYINFVVLRHPPTATSFFYALSSLNEQLCCSVPETFRCLLQRTVASSNEFREGSSVLHQFPSVTGSRSSGRAIGVVLLQPPPSPPSKMMKTSTTLRQGRRAQYYREDNHLFASRTMVVQKKTYVPIPRCRTHRIVQIDKKKTQVVLLLCNK